MRASAIVVIVNPSTTNQELISPKLDMVAQRYNSCIRSGFIAKQKGKGPQESYQNGLYSLLVSEAYRIT